MIENCPMSFFLSEYVATTTLETIQAMMSDFCTAFGFLFITYFAMDVPMTRDGTLLITNYPTSWKNHYFKQQYEKIDPVLASAKNCLTPLDWNELPPLKGAAQNFFTDAWKHGLGRQGITAPIRGQFGEFALISVNAEMSEMEWKQLWRTAFPDYIYFAFLLHMRVLHAIGAHKRSAPQLSQREAEVMRWAVRGKSAWETGQLTGLTERTVHFYIRNVCAKLEVATKMQAVARVVREHLILF